MEQQNNFERQYCDSLKRIFNEGIRMENRTGIDTLMVQHQYFHIETRKGFPMLKGKKVFPKMALKELLWMLQGRTDVKWLNKHGVTYWNEWTNNEGTIGRSYGYQYRNFNGIDQLKIMLQEMVKNPFGRRHILNLWNVSDLDKMELPPCMYSYHFEIYPQRNNNNVLLVNLHSSIRSNDSFLGAPYDFMFCAWLLRFVVDYLNVTNKDDKKTFIDNDIHYTADNYHLYVNHINQAEQYVKNVEENKFNIIDSVTTIDIPRYTYNGLQYDDIDLFIEHWIENIKNIVVYKPIYCGDEIDFEYPQIKADIAI